MNVREVLDYAVVYVDE